MSFKDNFHTGARSPEFACERIIGALADMQYPDGRPIDESQRVMVVDTFYTENVRRNPEYVTGQLPVMPKFLRDYKPYVIVQDRWGNPQYWPCESFLATFVPVNAEAPCEYEVESFLTDGFEELGTVNQQIAARMFRNPPVEGIHVVHIDPAEKMQVIGAMEGNVSVIREPVVYEDRDRLPLVAPVIGRKAILRNGMITGRIDMKTDEKTSYPFQAYVDGAVKSWVANGGYFHESVNEPDELDIVGLVEEDSDSCCDNESRNMNGGCDNCGDPSL